MSNQPYASPAPTHASGYDLATIFQPLADKSGWMKFIGIWMVIVGVLYSLSIIGAIIGVPIIIAGLNLAQGAGMLKGAYANDAGQLREACQKISTSAFIMGILLAIGVAMMVLYLLVVIGLVILSAVNGGIQ